MTRGRGWRGSRWLLPGHDRRSASSTSTLTRSDGIAYLGRVDPRLYDRSRRGPAISTCSRSPPTWPTSVSRAPSRCRPEAGELSFWVPRHRAHVGLLLRRGASWAPTTGRRCPTRTATPARTPATSALLARAAPVPRRTTRRHGQGCDPEGTTGEWHAASGGSFGYEQWTIDLSRYAGQTIELSLSSASDDIVAYPGVFVDDITGSGRAGDDVLRGRRQHPRRLDGARARRRAASRTRTTGRSGTAADAPEPLGTTSTRRSRSSRRSSTSSAGCTGRYPFGRRAAWSTSRRSRFALETQTRPVYSPASSRTRRAARTSIVHELAHQWIGDFLASPAGRTSGSTRASPRTPSGSGARRGSRDRQEIFDFYVSVIPADDPFWERHHRPPAVARTCCSTSRSTTAAR